jgi:benzodiazapine receptor
MIVFSHKLRLIIDYRGKISMKSICKKSCSDHDKKINYFSLFLWILTFQLIGFFIGKMTQSNITLWYQGLLKSPLNPPDVIFPIVWGLLYVLLAFIGWYLNDRRDKFDGNFIFILYSIQMIMNWLWTPLFFQWHLIELGFFWIIGIIFLVAMIIIRSLKKFKLVSLLLSPYLFWLMFASYLNYFIWVHN